MSWVLCVRVPGHLRVLMVRAKPRTRRGGYAALGAGRGRRPAPAVRPPTGAGAAPGSHRSGPRRGASRATARDGAAQAVASPSSPPSWPCGRWRPYGSQRVGSRLDRGPRWAAPGGGWTLPSGPVRPREALWGYSGVIPFSSEVAAGCVALGASQGRASARPDTPAAAPARSRDRGPRFGFGSASARSLSGGSKTRTGRLMGGGRVGEGSGG